MKHSLLTFAIGSMLAVSGWLPAGAQDATAEPIYQIATQDAYNECTAQCFTYDRDPCWSWVTYSGGYIRLWQYNYSKVYYDDYLTTPAISLLPGRLYRLVVNPAAYSSTEKPQIDVSVGQSDDPREFTVFYSSGTLSYGSNASSLPDVNSDFVVPEAGDYRLSVRGRDGAIKIYKFQLYDLGESATPAAVADLTVTPGAEGAASATVTFTLPSQTMTGQALSGTLSYSVSRDGASVADGTGEPGTQVTWTDGAAPEGTVTYSVTVAQNEEQSKASSATTFIGWETPAAVTDLTFVNADGVNTVSWTAPAGIHGVTLDPASLVYKVTRVIDGTETEAAEVTGVTTYSEPYTTEVPATVSYKVTATNGTKTSEAAETPKMKLGKISLPFADSFAGAQFSAVWSVEAVSGTGLWEALTDYYIGRVGSEEIEPVDCDGGLAGYNAYNLRTPNSSRLSTAPITLESSTNPTVEFRMYHDTGSTKQDKVQLQISVDNGEWTAFGDEILRNDGTSGWKKYMIAVPAETIAGCTTYRIGFLATSDYGNNIAIDAVRVFNSCDNDLEPMVEGPSKLVAGTTADITVTVANNGSTPIAADAYTVALSSDLAAEFTLPETQEVPSFGTVKFTVPVTVDAAAASAADSYSFTAEVTYASDSNSDNNTTEPLSVPTAFAQLQGVTELTVSTGDDGVRKLSWTPAGTPGYTPLSIFEDFEGFDEGATDDLNGFKVFDFDEKAGSTHYLCTGSKLNVFHPNTTIEVAGQKGLGVTLPGNTQQDDWFISPALSAADVSTFTFSVKAGFKQFSSSGYIATYDVVYSTEEYDPADPAAAFTHVVATERTGSYSSNIAADNKLHERIYADIPATAKYVAIHFKTKMSVEDAMWIDDVRIQENNPAPMLGYNVYQQGVGRLNAEVLSNSQLEYALGEITLPADGSNPAYFVTAVYPTGETAPSPVAELALPAAPSEITAVLSHDVFTGKNDVTLSWQAPEAEENAALSYKVTVNGTEAATVTETSYVAENVPSQENTFEVRTIADGLESAPATAVLAVSDSDYAKVTFSISSNNDFTPEDVKITVSPREMTEGEAAYELTAETGYEIGYLPKGEYSASAEAQLYQPWTGEFANTEDTFVDIVFEEITAKPYNLKVDVAEGIDDYVYTLSWNNPEEGAEPVEMGRVKSYSVTLDAESQGEPVTDTSVVLANVTEGEHTAGVKANYASGSTEESTVVFTANVFVGLTGIEGHAVTVTGLQGAIRISVDGACAAEVFDAAGKQISALSLSDETVLIPAAPGVYVVKAGTTAVKVAVR